MRKLADPESACQAKLIFKRKKTNEGQGENIAASF